MFQNQSGYRPLQAEPDAGDKKDTQATPNRPKASPTLVNLVKVLVLIFNGAHSIWSKQDLHVCMMIKQTLL